MSIREQLLDAFAGKPGRVVSGEGLAEKLGVSRVAVWKHVKALRALGFPFVSAGRAGYRSTVPVDLSLSTYPGHYFLNTRSTQILAKEGGESGLPEGHVWIAETQSGGHGRLERVWESGYGGLWFSLLLRPKLPASRVPPLTLLAGLSLSKAVEKVTGLRPTLKWPNDLLLGKKKVAGILTEMAGQIDRTDWIVLGVGLNVNNSISKALSDIATSLLRETGKSWNRATLLRAFTSEFMPAYMRFQKQGFVPFKVPYWSRYSEPRKIVRIKTSEGVLSGLACGVDDSGGIMIESRRKIDVIREGEIVL